MDYIIKTVNLTDTQSVTVSDLLQKIAVIDDDILVIESERAAYLSVLDKKKAYLQSERDVAKRQLAKLRIVEVVKADEDIITK